MVRLLFTVLLLASPYSSAHENLSALVEGMFQGQPIDISINCGYQFEGWMGWSGRGFRRHLTIKSVYGEELACLYDHTESLHSTSTWRIIYLHHFDCEDGSKADYATDSYAHFLGVRHRESSGQTYLCR